MARLGELLVAAGALTADQLDQALRAQVMWGARLGTNLVELGFLDLDAVSAALGQQHGMPAALARHFERVDRELQHLLSPDVAQRLSVVPLVRVGEERRIVIASASPLTAKGLAIVADELCVDPATLIPSIAAELRIKYQLEKVYDIGRPSRFMRSPDTARQSFQDIYIEQTESDVDLQPYRDPMDDLSIDVDLGDGQLAAPLEEVEQLTEEDLFYVEPTVDRSPTEPFARESAPNLDDLPVVEVDDLAVPTAIEQETSSGKERRKYQRTLAEGPSTKPGIPHPVPQHGSGPIATAGTLARVAIRKVKVKAPTEAANAGTLGEITRAIRRAHDRTRVADLVMDALFRFAPSCQAATILIVRGQLATSWRGFARSGAEMREVVVPMTEQGLVPKAVHRNQTTRAPMRDLAPVDQHLMMSLGEKGDLAIVPVSIAGQVMCVIAMIVEPDAQTGTAESVAAAAGAGFARLMRDASR